MGRQSIGDAGFKFYDLGFKGMVDVGSIVREGDSEVGSSFKQGDRVVSNGPHRKVKCLKTFCLVQPGPPSFRSRSWVPTLRSSRTPSRYPKVKR